MQTLVQVVCSKGKSLRDVVVNDPRLSDFDLKIQKKQQPGRSNGWAKIGSTKADGILNIEWDADTRILTCRVVNKRAGRPGQLLGDFVRYLFERRRGRIEAVNIIPR